MKKTYLIPDASRFTQSIVNSPLFCFRMEQEIKRSRFITSMARACSREEARIFIEAIRSEFFNAAHNCWAFAASAPGDTLVIGQSDDGEPHGTAGLPMLSILLHGKVGECVAVVTRYFGGIKLGTGGLVRAYQSCAAAALEQLPVTEKTELQRLTITFDFSYIGKIRNVLESYQAKILSERYQTALSYCIEFPLEQKEALCSVLKNITDGLILIEEC